MKTVIAVVENYKPVYLEDHETHVSLSSFRLELRECLKTFLPEIYFNKDVDFAKNLGCYLFGQPGKWKGVIGIDIKGNTEANEIEIYVDYRNKLDIDFIKDLFTEVLCKLKRDEIIKNYKTKGIKNEN